MSAHYILSHIDDEQYAVLEGSDEVRIRVPSAWLPELTLRGAKLKVTMTREASSSALTFDIDGDFVPRVEP